MRHVGEYPPAKTGEYPRLFPIFQNCARFENDLKDNKHNSLHLGENMFVYLSLDIIFSHQMEAIVYLISPN